MFAFGHDDLLLQDIVIENCVNCTLRPPFDAQTYSYFVLVPDDVQRMFFKTTPSENVSVVVDDAKLNVESLDDIEAMDEHEAAAVLLSFYNADQVDKETVAALSNSSFYEWLEGFVADQSTDDLIATKWLAQRARVEESAGRRKSGANESALDRSGLLSEAWTPVTVDIRYDLHHYRIFVVRRAGDFDVDEFRATMQMNKETLLRQATAQCPPVRDEHHRILWRDLDGDYC